MIFNVTGGGGAALNFKVQAYATEEELLAATPNENTIGIITDTPITSWLFSATEPSPAEAGMVWITIGISSAVEFNALKKNGIQVYPSSAKQYVGGSWVDKTAKSYQGGAWVEWFVWDGVLYNTGNEYADVTGGWTVSGAGQKNSESIFVGYGSTVANFSGTATHNDYVVLKDHSTLNVNFISGSAGGGSKSSVYVYVKDEGGDTVCSLYAYAPNSSQGASLKTIDISTLPAGKYKVSVVAANTASSAQICFAEFNKVEVV